MNVRPIDANALLQKIEAWDRRLRSFTHYTDRIALDVLCGVVEEIEDLDILEYAPVRHGEWEWDTLDVYMCSACGEKSHVKEVIGRPDWDYCPNCGAKMDGGKDDGWPYAEKEL